MIWGAVCALSWTTQCVLVVHCISVLYFVSLYFLYLSLHLQIACINAFCVFLVLMLRLVCLSYHKMNKHFTCWVFTVSVAQMLVFWVLTLCRISFFCHFKELTASIWRWLKLSSLSYIPLLWNFDWPKFIQLSHIVNTFPPSSHFSIHLSQVQSPWKWR
jgi:hypothetical protein